VEKCRIFRTLNSTFDPFRISLKILLLIQQIVENSPVMGRRKNPKSVCEENLEECNHGVFTRFFLSNKQSKTKEKD